MSLLKDKKILITRPEGQSKSWINSLQELGAIPVSFPLIEIKPICLPEIRDAVTYISRYDWMLFTSANGVRSFMSWLHNNEIQAMIGELPPIAVVGRATAAELMFFGHTVDLIPEKFTAADLANALGDVEGKRILLPTSTIAREELPNMLREGGATVDAIPVYDTTKVMDKEEELHEILSKGIDIVTLASPSAVEAFVEMEGPKYTRALYACIGPVTADRATELGLEVNIIAEPHTTEGLTAAMIKYFENEIQTKTIESK